MGKFTSAHWLTETARRVNVLAMVYLPSHNCLV